MTSHSITIGARNAGLEDILRILQDQRARRLDVVVRHQMILSLIHISEPTRPY